MTRLPSGATLRRMLISVGLALAFGAIPSFGWWYVMERDAPAAQVFDIQIRPGTAAAIAAGESPPTIPDTLNFRSNASLRIVNNDLVAHEIGSQFIESGQERVLPISDFLSSGQGRFVCTFHPGGAINLQVGSGDASPLSAVWATLIFAAPLAAVSFGVTTVLNRI
jgi:hypothetical protein